MLPGATTWPSPSSVCSDATLHTPGSRGDQEIGFTGGIAEQLDRRAPAELGAGAMEPGDDALVGPRVSQDRDEPGDQLLARRRRRVLVAAALQLADRQPEQLGDLRHGHPRQPLFEQA